MTTPERAIAVELQDVHKTYHLHAQPLDRLLERFGVRRAGAVEFHALDGVSLRVPKGERLGIVGRNGAGKTTLLKLVTGNFGPTSGRVAVDGQVQALMQVGLGFYAGFTGYENARSALLYNGLAGDALELALADVIDFCELGEFLHQPMSTYSLGMRARLQFATATAIRPDILIVDEIMGAGDAYFSAKSADRMKRLTASGCTLLLVSHSANQVLEFCETAIWLERGRILLQGPAHDVMDAYEAHLQQLAAHGSSTAVAASPLESRVALEDGRRVHRWPGKTGLKVTRLALTDGAREIDSSPAAGRVRVHFEVVAETDAEFSCAYIVTIWDARMKRIARIEGHDGGFRLAKGERRNIVADLSPLLLRAGDYHLWVSIYDRTGGQRAGPESRFDVLSRALTLSVTGEQAPPYYEHPAAWTFGT